MFPNRCLVVALVVLFFVTAGHDAETSIPLKAEQFFEAKFVKELDQSGFIDGLYR